MEEVGLKHNTSYYNHTDMLATIKKILGLSSRIDFTQLIQNGAQVVDVRTPGEFQQGHLPGAINIPLNTLSHHSARLKKDKAIITCCASGMRSASAKSILQSKGFPEVYNGGGWLQLQRRLR